MKLLIAKLAASGLIPSNDMSDETLIVQAFERGIAPLNALRASNETLTNRVATFETAQKLRVTNRVTQLVTDKLVKEDRKDALIAMGVRDESELDSYVNDLLAARGTQTPAPKVRGAAPLPIIGETRTPEERITEIRNDMNTRTSSAKTSDEIAAAAAANAESARELRKLRGHDSLFAVKA